MKTLRPLFKSLLVVGLASLALTPVSNAQLLLTDGDIDTINDTYDFALLAQEIQIPGSNFSQTDLGGALVTGSVTSFVGGPETTGGTPVFYWFAWDSGARAEFKMEWDFTGSSYGISSVDFLNKFDSISGTNTPTLEYSTDQVNFTALTVISGLGLQSYNVPGLAGAQIFTIRIGFDMDGYAFPDNQWGRGDTGDTSFSASFDLIPVPEPSSVALMLVGVVGMMTFSRRRRNSLGAR